MGPEGEYQAAVFCKSLTWTLLSPLEEFNDKILSPELSDSELQRLHGEVLHIYETYCLDESVDKISFDKFIVEEIRNSKRTRFPVTLQTFSDETWRELLLWKRKT